MSDIFASYGDEKLMNILIAGGSGFIGTALTNKLIASNHTVTVLTRSSRRALASERIHVRQWDARYVREWATSLDGCDAVVNLSGENIGGKRWSASQKERLVQSRIQSTAALVEAMKQAAKKPAVFVCASAVGYYGDVPDVDATEERAPGSDFLASLCEQWEAEAMKASPLGIRVVCIRSGIILSKSGGALPRLLLPFRLFAGGPLGSGKQWFPWIHLDDELRAIQFAIEHVGVAGPINLAAPNPLTMREFCSALGTALHRPSWAPVPGFVLRILLGEMAGPLLLSGQRAIPNKLLAAGFQFRFNTAEEALKDIWW